MILSHALRMFIIPSPHSPIRKGGEGECIAFAGAGGKTTGMFQLARELSARSPVLVTATTHLGAWQTALADRHRVAESPQEVGEISEGITLVTGALDGDRTRPIDSGLLLWLHDISKKSHIPLLIEADGARSLPLKAPAAHEPPIPGFVNRVIVVAGLGGLNQTLGAEFVFRPERFAEIGGLETGQSITPQILTRVLRHPEGGLKNIPASARRIALLNQADTLELQAAAQRMGRALLETFDAVLVASLRENAVHAAHERAAGIILAAGESKRFGGPKQLLDWHGKPFVRAVAGTALEAGLSPVILVTGAEAERVGRAVEGLNLQIVYNEKWQSGQASSIVTGIRALPENAGSAVFLLADQPQIPAEVMRALVEKHAQSLPAILAPLVLEEKRANPVLFDRLTFPDLLALTGEAGGRAIFGRQPVEYLPWHDDVLLLDVDTPEDYERLKGL